MFAVTAAAGTDSMEEAVPSTPGGSMAPAPSPKSEMMDPGAAGPHAGNRQAGEFGSPFNEPSRFNAAAQAKPVPPVLMRPGFARPTAMVATSALYEGVVTCTVVLVFPATAYGTMALIWLGPA